MALVDLTQRLPRLTLSGLGVGMVLPSLTAATVCRLSTAHYVVSNAVIQVMRQIGLVTRVPRTVLPVS